MKRIILQLAILLMYFGKTSPLLAQNTDTVFLQNLEIYGLPTEKYAAGSSIVRIDSIAKISQIHASLSDLLEQESSLYFKEYGYGMLSGISMRGTSSSHTAVLWNGINLNSATLGSTDFSNLPVFMFDDIQLHLGGGSAQYGSDAIGGSIILTSKTDQQEGTQLQAHQTVGSFGQFFSGLKAHFGLSRWQLSSTAYRRREKNDFPFKNTSKYGTPEERQQNADVHNFGLMQELSFQPASNRRFSLNAWYEESENGILPIMSSNLQESSYERISDRHFRSSFQFEQQQAWGYLQATLGYVHDEQVYNQQAPIIAEHLLTRLQYDKHISQRLNFKLGADWRYVQADVESYQQQRQQKRADAFASLAYLPYAWWTLNLNLRQAWVSAYKAPFAPALGSEISLHKSAQQQLILKNQFSRSFRIPTFNDLYWQPGGKPELRAEQGWSLESGLLLKRENLEAEITYFHTNMDDWIVWLDQGSFWSPQNFRKVVINGLETRAQYLMVLAGWQLRLSAQYAYTSSINKSPVNQYDRSKNKQLPYVPLHRLTFNTHAQWKSWSVDMLSQWTSERFLTTTNESALEAYGLLDFRINRSISWWKTQNSLSFRLNNLLNTSYQNVAGRAMPGRNYQLSLQLRFSN